MQEQQLDSALQAANLALSGRKLERTASRFASIQLRDLDEPARSDRQHVIWEVAAVSAVAVAALLAVWAIWAL